MQQIAIYPGTFDPITKGHLDIISRAHCIFPKVIVAVSNHSRKAPYFSLGTRMQLIEENIKNFKNVQVLSFDSLLIDFAKQQAAGIILRSLRTFHDFEYELQLARMNNKLSHAVETIFFAPSEHLAAISSTLVREIAALKGDVSAFVPENVVAAFTMHS